MEDFIVFATLVLSCIGTGLGLYEGTNEFHPIRTRVMLLRTFAFSAGALASLVVLILTGVIQ